MRRAWRYRERYCGDLDLSSETTHGSYYKGNSLSSYAYRLTASVVAKTTSISRTFRSTCSTEWKGHPSPRRSSFPATVLSRRPSPYPHSLTACYYQDINQLTGGLACRLDDRHNWHRLELEECRSQQQSSGRQALLPRRFELLAW